MSNSLSQNTPQDNPSHKKWCPKCRAWLSFRAFPIARGKKYDLHYCCRECKNKRAREITTTEQIRSWNMRRIHDISLKEYARMFAEQGGVCYICKQPETAKSRTGEIKPLAVDHNHNTDENRMLLCQACNLILGVIETNLDRLDVFLGYLEEMEQREPVTKIVQLRLMD